jgi:hypothetical protein
VQRVNFYVLFIEDAGMVSGGYYYLGGQSMVYDNTYVSSAFTYTVNNYTQTVFILALRGLSGYSGLNNATWGWSIANTTNDTATLNIDRYQLTSIYFSFLQIGLWVNPTTTTPDTAEGGGSGAIGIIAGLVVALVVGAVVVYFVCRYCWKREVY